MTTGGRARVALVTALLLVVLVGSRAPVMAQSGAVYDVMDSHITMNLLKKIFFPVVLQMVDDDSDPNASGIGRIEHEVLRVNKAKAQVIQGFCYWLELVVAPKANATNADRSSGGQAAGRHINVGAYFFPATNRVLSVSVVDYPKKVLCPYVESSEQH